MSKKGGRGAPTVAARGLYMVPEGGSVTLAAAHDSARRLSDRRRGAAVSRSPAGGPRSAAHRPARSPPPRRARRSPQYPDRPARLLPVCTVRHNVGSHGARPPGGYGPPQPVPCSERLICKRISRRLDHAPAGHRCELRASAARPVRDEQRLCVADAGLGMLRPRPQDCVTVELLRERVDDKHTVDLRSSGTNHQW